MSEMRQFRSRLNALPLDLKLKIGEIPYQKGMLPISRKEKILEELNKSGIEFLEVGTGTNRLIVKIDGFALKIALDNEGIADNRQEWVMSELLAPHVAKAYDISKGGHLLVASFAPAFTSFSEMMGYADTIRNILKKWGERYLLGDVGLTKVNYANWGLNAQHQPVCIDYAYIFPANMNIFKCLCGSQSLVFADSTFSSYKCTSCGKRFEDRELRMRISQKERMEMFENVSGIKMKHEFEQHEVDDKYIKLDDNPDVPNIYDVAYNEAQIMMGQSNDIWNFGPY